MTVGTKSVLFGAHCFFIHPLFVALAWWKLYGFPWDPRLWVAFIVHDWGYWGKPNMDGKESETHPELGALIMWHLFDRYSWDDVFDMPAGKWHDLCLYHSRYCARHYGRPFSKLCVADKLVTALEPAWLYLPRVCLSGEIREYMAMAEKRARANEAVNSSELVKLTSSRRREWYAGVRAYLRRWAEEHKDKTQDNWTPPRPFEVEFEPRCAWHTNCLKWMPESRHGRSTSAILKPMPLPAIERDSVRLRPWECLHCGEKAYIGVTDSGQIVVVRFADATEKGVGCGTAGAD